MPATPQGPARRTPELDHPEAYQQRWAIPGVTMPNTRPRRPEAFGAVTVVRREADPEKLRGMGK